MSKEFFVNVNGEARRVKAWYANVNGEARRVIKAYANVNGEARLFWDGSGEANHVIFYGNQLKYTPHGVDFEEFVRSVTSWNGNQSAYNMTDVVSSFFTNKCILKDPNNSGSGPFVMSSIIEQGNTLNHNIIGFFIPVQRIRNITGWRVVSRDDKVEETRKMADLYFLAMTASASGLRRIAMEQVGNGKNWFVQANRDRLPTTNVVDYVGFLIAKPSYYPNPADPTECLMQIKTIELLGGRAHLIAVHSASQYIQHASLTQLLNPRPELYFKTVSKATGELLREVYMYASKTNGGAVCTDETIYLNLQAKWQQTQAGNTVIGIVMLSRQQFYMYSKYNDEQGTWYQCPSRTYQGITYYYYYGASINTDLNGERSFIEQDWYKINEAESYFSSAEQMCDELAYVCFGGTIS